MRPGLKGNLPAGGFPLGIEGAGWVLKLVLPCNEIFFMNRSFC